MKLFKNKIFWIVLAAIVIVTIVVIIILKKNNKSQQVLKSVPGNTDTQKNISEGEVFPLAYGSQGENVKKLQTALNNLMSMRTYIIAPEKLTIDGIFGEKTLNTVKTVLNRTDVPLDVFKQII